MLIEQDAGADSGISDADYRAAGAEVVARAEDVWARAGLVLKVKEPQEQEFVHLRRDLVLFTYLHLAAYPEVAVRVARRGNDRRRVRDGATRERAAAVARADERSRGAHGAADRCALPRTRAHGGRGVLLGGAPGVRPARVVVLGAGNVGWNAAWIAQGMEAEVLLLDKNLDRLRWVDQIHKGRIMTLASNRGRGGARGRRRRSRHRRGARARWPGTGARHRRHDQDHETRGGDRRLRHRPGRLHREHPRDDPHDPVYSVHGVLHYAVGNVPGAVPNTSTYALTNATLPYAIELATKGPKGAADADPALAVGINTCGGAVPNAAVAEALEIAARPLADCTF